jgi:hypothetical protein
MTFFEKNKKIILFLVILAVVVTVYELFFTGGPSQNSQDPTVGGLVSDLSASPTDAIIGRDLLVMLQQLKSITLDTTFFESPGFASLADVSRPIDPQPFGKPNGRVNPFGDFGRITGISQSATSTIR